MSRGKAFIGTSGWSYKHWKGTFYPASLRSADEFNFYSQFFHTVEINNSFYRLPAKETFTSWRTNSPGQFLFAVKASRFITHMKKLKDVQSSIDLVMDRFDGLEEKLGPILFQLPPGWNINLERLAVFLEQLPKGYRFAIEFRNATWYTTEVYEMLRRHNIAFCIYELAGHTSPILTTTDWVYVRLHGPTLQKYQGSYQFDTLAAWADRCRSWQKAGKDVYLYFDNDEAGHAAFNAQVLELMINHSPSITAQEASLLATIMQCMRNRQCMEWKDTNHAVSQPSLLAPYCITVPAKGRGPLTLWANELKEKQGSSRLTRIPFAVLLNGTIRIKRKQFELPAADAFIQVDPARWRIVYRLPFARQ